MSKPNYIAIAAITLDGKIAKHKSHMSSWTSKEDKVFMRGLLDKCDVIIVGNNTYKTAIVPLSKRNCIVISRTTPPPPLGEGRGEGHKDNLIYCLPKKSALQKIIKQKNYKTIAILGGAQTYAFCLQNNLLDELYLTIEPIVFGQGINLFSVLRSPSPFGRGVRGEGHKNYKFKLISTKKLNKQGSLLLKYIMINPKKNRKELLRKLAITVDALRRDAKEKGIDKMSKREIQAAVSAMRRDLKKEAAKQATK